VTETQITPVSPENKRRSTMQRLDDPTERELLWEAIVEEGSVNKAASKLDLHRPSIYLKAQKDEQFAAELLAAEATNLRQLVDECIHIADDSSQDLAGHDKGGNPIPNTEFIQRARLRIETRIRLAGKLIPHIYGDKAAQVNVQSHTTVQAVIVPENQRQSLIELRERLLSPATIPATILDSAGPEPVHASTTADPLPQHDIVTSEASAQ
jgi:hypothetical protein